MPSYRASETRRSDPALRKKVAAVCAARQEALEEASALLKQASEILRKNAHFAGDPIYERQVKAVSIASNSLARDTTFDRQGVTETYIGNAAAGELGEQIQKMGDSFTV